MGREDALLSLDRHATSKISDPGGAGGDPHARLPRGGAPFHRLCRAHGHGDGGARGRRDARGRRRRARGGSVEPCARRRGTTVTVRSLFFNVPARAKFLRSAAAEARAVSEVVTTLALANPRVAFPLESNGRDLLDLPATFRCARANRGAVGRRAGRTADPAASRGVRDRGDRADPAPAQRHSRRPAHLPLRQRPLRSPTGIWYAPPTAGTRRRSPRGIAPPSSSSWTSRTARWT